MKYMLISYLILAIVMIFFANQMLQVKDNLEKKVLGTYVRQFEEINKATGMDVYNLKGETNYKETLKALEEIQ